MRQALPVSGKNSSRPVSLPAPVGGWNALDSIADMPAKDAVYLENFFPRTSDVMIRKGSAAFASLPAGKEIRTLMGYKSPTGVAKIFAAGMDGIYDITAGDTSTIASAATDNRWQSTNVTTAGGSFLWCCNGVDKARLFNGAAWTVLDGASTPALTGVTSTDVANVSLFKTRLILCVKNSLSFWYLPNNAIAGAAVEFPLGALFRKGGYLMATTTWTLDGGNGPDDYFVAMTSEGEIAVYKGTDPSSSSTFSLVGVFQLAAPVGRRCFVRMAADTFVMTKSAIYPLSKALQTNNPQIVAVTRKIERAYADFYAEKGALFGWEAYNFADASMLVVNIPLVNYAPRNSIYSCQFVMNTTTGAWSRFTGWHAECWLAFDGKLYSAVHNKVMQRWTGTSDAGASITATAKTAFMALRSASVKHIKLARPILTSGGSITVQLGVDVDYSDNLFTTSSASYVQNLTQWDSAVWNQSVWNGSSSTIAVWRSVNSKPGRAVAVRLRASTKDATMLWNATDLILGDGGLI